MCSLADRCPFLHDLNVLAGMTNKTDENQPADSESRRSSPGKQGSLEMDQFPSLQAKDSSSPGAASSSDRCLSVSPPSGMHGGSMPVAGAATTLPEVAEEPNAGLYSDVTETAQVVPPAASTAGEGKKGRKGGRNRKTRYKVVNMQELLRSPPDEQSFDEILNHSKSSSVVQSKHAWGDSRTASKLPSFADVAGSSIASPSQAITTSTRAKQASRDVSVRARTVPAPNEATSWVSTGDAVASQYKEAREKASELARARNKMFIAATEAFQRGQGLLARDLARKGRDLNIRMKKLHREAAKSIFESRNPGDQAFLRRSMDLHGLHVQEVNAVLEEMLPALANRGLPSIRIITGSGHHSKGPTSKARLMPAVQRFCYHHGYPYSEEADRGTGHIGVIFVTLQSQGPVGTALTAGQQHTNI